MINEGVYSPFHFESMVALVSLVFNHHDFDGKTHGKYPHKYLGLPSGNLT
jgi:hypothetical protein